ncbi:MAG: bifunctional serine/threonine-protein kinase/formylglycine-generating enzyme family protein [Isosphaeraceae bacterium]
MPGPPTSTYREAQEIPNPFGRYTIVRRLGQGGMGSVYLAEDTKLGRRVALKVPRGLAGERGEVVARFEREARVLAGLSHPNICRVYDVGEIGGHHYLTMEYHEGRALDAVLTPGKPLKPAQAVRVARKLARALQQAHERGVVHRDLKPSNVMMTADKNLIILDFGLARRVAEDESATALTQTGQTLGTPAYMAPEQVQADPSKIGPACDVYSLGVMLYEMLTGRRPFNGPVTMLFAQIVHDPPEPPSKFRPDLPPALEAACLKALAKNPADRFGSMAEFASALEASLAETGVEISGENPEATGEVEAVAPPPPSPPPAFGAWLKGLVVLGAAAAVLVVVVNMSMRHGQTVRGVVRRVPVPAPTPTPVTDLSLVRVEPGSFVMGTPKVQSAKLGELFPETKATRFDHEQPAHRVRITRPFFLSAHEVTVGQFRRFVEATGYRTEAEKNGLGGWGLRGPAGGVAQDPKFTWKDAGYPQTDRHPVVNVSWDDAKAYCDWLTKTEGPRRGLRFRLPTEAEWEYACRAGTTGLFGASDDPETLARVANVVDAQGSTLFRVRESIRADDGHVRAAPVRSYRANGFGLHDMLGNVWEWCEDVYSAEYYTSAPFDDPHGPPAASGESPPRVFRGGAWNLTPRAARPATRRSNLPAQCNLNLGFRVVGVLVK